MPFLLAGAASFYYALLLTLFFAAVGGLGVLVMAVGHYFLDVRILGRSAGKSAVASAAYRAGQNLQDERRGQSFDYTRKGNIERSEIYAPQNSPAWAHDRAKLWNEVERVERRKDAQLAREVIVSLPREVPEEKRYTLVKTFVDKEFVSRGMIADVSWHNPKAGDGKENPHAHIMLTMRNITPEGFGQKNREWNTAVFTRDDMIKDKSQLVGLRAAWAEHVNSALSDSGTSTRVSHKSYKEQGLAPANPGVPFTPHHIEKRTGKSLVYGDILHERHFKQVESFKSRRATPAFKKAIRHSQQIEDYEFIQKKRRAHSFTVDNSPPPPNNPPPGAHRKKLLQERQQDNDVGMSI